MNLDVFESIDLRNNDINLAHNYMSLRTTPGFQIHWLPHQVLDKEATSAEYGTYITQLIQDKKMDILLRHYTPSTSAPFSTITTFVSSSVTRKLWH